jgi:hypothetical protein
MGVTRGRADWPVRRLVPNRDQAYHEHEFKAQRRRRAGSYSRSLTAHNFDKLQ